METPTTRTDRAAEASAEAERRYPESWDHYNDEPVDDWGYSECQREAFCAGMAWADANPQPDTLREAQVAAWEEGRASAGILLPTMPPQQPRNPYRRDESDE